MIFIRGCLEIELQGADYRLRGGGSAAVAITVPVTGTRAWTSSFLCPVVVRSKIISIRGKAGPRFGSVHPFPLKQAEDFQL